jgi:hypothetical protein
MNKLVIANKGIRSQGKSSSIKKVFDKLQSKYPNGVITYKKGKEIKAILIINNIKIGIESEGDPFSRIFESIDEFVKENCDIIVVACRTRGETYDKVKSLENEGYEIKWLSNERSTDKSKHDELNDQYAEKIFNMIEDIVNNKN